MTTKTPIDKPTDPDPPIQESPPIEESPPVQESPPIEESAPTEESPPIEECTASLPSSGRARRLLSLISRKRSWILALAEHLVLAGIAYIPLILVKPGVETSDTKTFLYLDPGRFVHQVSSMWDPSVALGTVTHQYIGYLLPMGPFYWFFSAVGVPVWVTQRLWLGSILFAAGAGVGFLGRNVHLRAPGRTVAALAFMLTPYFLQYAGRISVILLPWAALPFMVAFTARALRRGGWRYPALFALAVAVTSGINASSVVYIGIAPILWLVFAVAIEREATWRQAAVTALRIGVLTLLCGLWWIEGLVVEAGYGVDVLRYTETLQATSETSSAAEVVRGLGYWYFYGADRLGPWTASSLLYTQQVWLLAVSYLVPVLSFLSAIFVRWRYRAYFVLLVVVGMVLSVGIYPYSDPTPAGSLLKEFMTRTTAGFALRSSDRATPLVVLGLAILLGAGVSALRLRFVTGSLIAAGIAIAAVIAANPALFNGDAEVASFFVQPAKLPHYETAAMSYLNAHRSGSRVLGIPGNDFASYRWGDTVDTPQAGLLNRPFVTREQQVMGSIPTADTLFAIDDPIQSQDEQWNSLAPMARLLSVGDVLVEYDQRYEHYGTPQPQVLAQQLKTTPSGLSDPVYFGKPRPNISSFPTIDEQDLGAPAPLTWPAPLADYTVAHPRPITRAESDSGAVLVDGDATGLENMAGLGLLDTNSSIYYAGTLASRPKQLHQVLAKGAGLVLTDTNRKQGFRWNTLFGNYGETETPSQNPAKSDPSDSPIDLFPGAPVNSKTTALYIGAVDVTASSYGNALSYAPEHRPYSAIDGNLDPSWITGTFVPDPAGQWWQVRFGAPVTTSQITLVQPQNGDNQRWISRVTLTFDNGRRHSADLGASSRTASGQELSFAPRTFHTLRITIDATTNDHMSTSAATAIGFAEVRIPAHPVTEVFEMPSDLLHAAGASSIHNRLTIAMSRQRVSPTYPTRQDTESTISREFWLPTARTFTLSGSASMSALIPDDEIDRLAGRPGSTGSGVVAFSKGRLPGDLRAGAAAAADGSLATSWEPGFDTASQFGEWLEYDLPKSTSFDHLDMQIVADGRHSVATSLTISTENGTRSVSLPSIHDRSTSGATVAAHVSFPSLSGQTIRITITGVRLEKKENYYAETPIALPLGIAEVGIPGVHVAPYPATLPGNCLPNLITIDEKPISVSVVGSTGTALDNGEMSIVPCGTDASGITLGPGIHVVETSLGHSDSTGWDIDQLTLDSAPGGRAAPPAFFDSFDAIPATQAGATPKVSVRHSTKTTESLTVTGATAPFELVLGESSNSGWKAVASPLKTSPAGARSVDLGSPQLVDGFANGWQVTSHDLAALGAGDGRTFVVNLDWAPQRTVWIALAVSAVSIGACAVLVLLPSRLRINRRRRTHVGRKWRKTHFTRTRRANAVETAALTAGYAGANELQLALTTEAPLALSSPVLSSPLTVHDDRPPVWVIVLLSVASGLVAGAITAVPVGAAIAAATAAALSFRWLRGLLTLGAVGLLADGVVKVVAGQATHPIPESSNWPPAYNGAALLVWMAVVTLGADAVVVTARRWREKPTTGEVGPVGDGPVEDDPVEDGPVEDDPVEEEGPVEDDPVEDGPVEEDPVEQDPVEKDPVEDHSHVEDHPRRTTSRRGRPVDS